MQRKTTGKLLTLALTLTVALTGLKNTAEAAFCNWTGTAKTEEWSNPGNWEGGKIPGKDDTAVFNGVLLNVYIKENTTVNTVRIEPASMLVIKGDSGAVFTVLDAGVAVTPGPVPVRFSNMTLDARVAEALTLTGNITVNKDGRLTSNKNRMLVAVPAGKLTIGENSVLTAGHTTLRLGANSWLKPENRIVMSETDELAITNDVAANGTLWLDGTLTFSGNAQDGGLLAYPNTEFTLYTGGAMLKIAGGDEGSGDSIENPLNGIELIGASITSSREGLVINGEALAYGTLRVRGNLIFTPGSSLLNYDDDGFTLLADGRPMMFRTADSFVVVRDGGSVEFLDGLAGFNGISNVPFEQSSGSGLKKKIESLNIDGVEFHLLDDMPGNGIITIDGALNFKDGGVIVYPKMLFTLRSKGGASLTIAGDTEHDNYDDPLNGLDLSNAELVFGSSGIAIAGAAQGFGVVNMHGTLTLDNGSKLGNYDRDGFTLVADNADLVIKARGTSNSNMGLKGNKRAIFAGSDTPNANAIENQDGKIIKTGNVSGFGAN